MLQNGGFGIAFACIAQDRQVGGITVGEECDATAHDLNGQAPCVDAADCPIAGQECNANGVCQLANADFCADAVCWPQGLCAGPCGDDADCPADMACQHFSFAFNAAGDEQNVALCRPFAGSATPCTDDTGCTAPEVCALAQSDAGETIGACRAPLAGEGVRGDSCNDDPNTIDVFEPIAACGTEVCVLGFCESVCADDADCPNGAVCFNQFEAPGLCATAATCALDGDCPANETCAHFADAAGDALTVCLGTVGTLDVGAACSNDGAASVAEFTCIDDAACDAEAGDTGFTCAPSSNTCIPPVAELCRSGACDDGARCSATCDVDADCPADMLCLGAPNVFNDQGDDDATNDEIAFFGRCVIAGDTVCAKDADCNVAGGEHCKGVIERDGSALTGRCTVPPPGAAAFGDPCNIVDGAFVACPGVCEFDAEPSATVVEGICRTPCVVDGDCTAPETCGDLDTNDFGAATGLTAKVCK